MSIFKEHLDKIATTDLICIAQHESVTTAAKLMKGPKEVGSLLVKEGEKTKGIITERDVVQRVVAEEKDPSNTQVKEVMTTELVTCNVNENILIVANKMHEEEKKKMLVEADGKIIGIITQTDIINMCTVDNGK